MNWSSEGNGDDIRFYVDPEELVSLWPRLFLPTYVRPPWEAWLRDHGVDI